MTATHDVTTIDPSACAPNECNCLHRELLGKIFERTPIPIVVDFGADDVFLNCHARALWFTENINCSKLPVIVNGKTQSLLTLPCLPDDGVELVVRPQVRVPEGKEYEVEIFFWKPEADSPSWRIIILQPLDHGFTEGILLTDKVSRLKAIVHEFRNALTAAQEGLALLHEGAVGELNAEQQRFLNSVIEDLESMGRGTVELTSLWTTQAVVLRLMPRPIDMKRVVEQTTLCAQPVAEKSGVSLCVEITEPLPILTGDHKLLVQALRNVLSNAIRHTSTGGEVLVRAFGVQAWNEHIQKAEHVSNRGQTESNIGDESIVIEIYDTGPGIEPADQERIFKPFERGTSTGLSQGSLGSEGMGLGLAIARDITERHGGMLRIRSTTGEGSCFVFRFPISKTCARSWMLRATQQALEDVRPLRAPLAAVLLRFGTDHSNLDEHVHPNVFSAVQQIAIQNLRPTDTVLAIESQLLLLIRGSTRSGAYAMIDRVLHSLTEIERSGGPNFGEYNMVFGAAASPEDGDSAEEILSRAEAELSTFSIR